MPPKKGKKKKGLQFIEKPNEDAESSTVGSTSDERQTEPKYERRRTTTLTSKSSVLQDTPSRVVSFISSGAVSEMSITDDIITMIVPETSQKIVHCLIGQDLFVDRTWCTVKKEHILEDIAIQDKNSPFFAVTQKILSYPVNELLIGYEPFSSVPNQFMLCITEAGRDQVLEELQNLKITFTRRIEQSKLIEPKKWESQGSEEFVDQFQLKDRRKKFSLEWIGDLTKRCLTKPQFEDCDPDSLNDGYTCLLPSNKENFELVFKKTQDTGIQAVAQKTEVSVQTVPEIPTNACTQYAPETEISVPPSDNAQEAITSQDLNAFFKKYLDYLLDSLKYNEVYDLYHDDYTTLFDSKEEAQIQTFGTYHQYQSFTDVAAIEGKMVISTSWHPTYTGIVAIAYANEIPALMEELEFDSDQTDYEDEKTDPEGEGEEVELGVGAKEWLEDERRELESTSENTDAFDKAIKKLKDIEASKMMWDAKIQEPTEEMRMGKTTGESDEKEQDVYKYREYIEPEPEPEPEENEETTPMAEDSEAQEGREDQDEASGRLATEETVSAKTSRMSFREHLEAEVLESMEDTNVNLLPMDDKSSQELLSSPLPHESSSVTVFDYSKDQSLLQGSYSAESSRKKVHHHKKHRRNVTMDKTSSTVSTPASTVISSRSLSALESQDTVQKNIVYEPEYFEEITDEEEIKEKQDELPLLEVNNPVLIWSFVDDLTPKLRLDSPYEVRVVAFSKHDGNIIAGGTSSGQVVLWDITGRIEALEKPESLTPDQQMFRKRMEDLMKWRQDIRSKRRVRISAISNQAHSHIEKVTSLMWVSPIALITDKVDIIRNPTEKMVYQLLTTSIQGDLKVWDLQSEPLRVDHKKQAQLFKTKNRFGRPSSLDTGLSPLRRLNRKWKSIIQFNATFKNEPVPLTGFRPHSSLVKYVRVTPRMSGQREALEDRVEYRLVFQEFKKIPTQMYISNLFGRAGTIFWEPLETKLHDGELVPHTVQLWDLYHDGPITRIARHPLIPSICLTVGGHVFSIWHVANSGEPIFSKRYFGVRITDGIWSSLKPSLIRIARSDGVLEIWDLIIQSHEPATTISVSGRVITNISPPLLPEVRGLLGVADYNSAFRLFFIPPQFRMWTEQEFERFKKFIEREPERREKMRQWSEWWRENNVNFEREVRRQAEEKKKLDEEERIEKEKQEEARKKYNEEVYKWYMRRRGKPFLWEEEAEEKWREKQEEHMHEVIMAKKKIDRSEMEILMRPIIREEKNEAQKHAKAQERLKQADIVFRQAVEQIFPKSAQEQTKVTDELEKYKSEILKVLEYYYGENFGSLADEQNEIVNRSPWQFDFEWYDLLEKYNSLRMLFNDRRRKRSKTLRWLRKKLREELMKEGRKVHIRKSHMERYQKRKIERRQENLGFLKNLYGEDYNVYWDKSHPCRRFVDRKFKHPIEETDSHLLGVLSEPEVEDEEWPQLLSEGKVQSSLELITEVGIEHVPDEVFAADLDTTLLTMESKTSASVKAIPSLKFDVPTVSAVFDESILSKGTQLSSSRGFQSPKNVSDTSVIPENSEDIPTTAGSNELEELDYIQHPISTITDTSLKKKVPSSHKREISEGILVKTQDSSEDFSIQEEIPDSVTDNYSEMSVDTKIDQPENERQEGDPTDEKDEHDIQSTDGT